MKNIEKLEQSLTYEFKDKNLLIHALTHKSFKNLTTTNAWNF